MTLDELLSLQRDVQTLMDRIAPHADQSDNDAAGGGVLIFLHGMRLAAQGLTIVAGTTECDLDAAVEAVAALHTGTEAGQFKIIVPSASRDRALRYLRLKLKDGLEPVGFATKTERPQ